jgi:hypothetical protein
VRDRFELSCVEFEGVGLVESSSVCFLLPSATGEVIGEMGEDNAL